MKIIVLNGSPKGDQSVTMQYVHYFGKHLPSLKLKIFNIAERIRSLEKNDTAFEEIIAEISSAQGVLWAFPVYLLLVPSNYKRFIEMIWEKGSKAAFKGKYTTVLTTSIHFHDHIAHNYMNGICDDLGMNFVNGFSADMYDLLKEKERDRLLQFAKQFIEAIQSQIPMPQNYNPLISDSTAYTPCRVSKQIRSERHRIMVLTDEKNEGTNLGKMVNHFVSAVSGNVEVANLHDIDMKGSCIGCLQCSYDNKCVYDGKDAFIPFYNEKIKPAHILVMAGSITDRYLSSRWKQFFDRSFFNNHVPTMASKQLGFIISGPLRQLPNLRQALEGFAEVQRAGVVDFITDEYSDSSIIDGLLNSLAARLIHSAEQDFIRPATFLGIGGQKVFRDDLYIRLRFPFRKDHQYYKKNNFYDFPYKDRKLWARNTFFSLLSRVPAIRKEVYVNRMKSEMIKPLQQILENQKEKR